MTAQLAPSQTISVPSEVALAELRRVHAYARQQVAQGADRAMASAHVAKWCAIAAWFGAALPDDLAMHDHIAGAAGGAPLWTDYAPPGTPPADWRRTIALELRRTTERAIDRADPPLQGEVAAQRADGGVTRASNLLTLDRHLSAAAGLPAMGAEQRKAA